MSALGRIQRTTPAVSLPGWLVEALARFGSVALHWRGLGRLSVESRLRGILRGPGLRAEGLIIGRRVELDGSAIKVGNGVRLYGDVYLGSGPNGFISVGAGTEIDRGTVIYGHGGVEIGRECAIAAGVTVYSQSNQYRPDPLIPVMRQAVTFDTVSIGDYGWIGAGAVILPGVSLGANVVVGAGAVVTKSVEPWAVVAGVPARIVNDRRRMS